MRLTKRAYGWPEDAKFLVPDGVRERFAAGIGARGADAHRRWTELFAGYRAKYPELALEIDQMQRRELPAGWDRDLPIFPADAKGIAGRDASGQVLNALARNVPWLIGGSADLAPSTKTLLKIPGAGDQERGSAGGRNLHFGIREHAMGAIAERTRRSRSCGRSASTFLIFSDYLRPALRLSALMELPVLWVFTHDAMGDGEDGPTHQPVEQLASLRAIPGLVTLRPADANEVVEAYRTILPFHHGPVALALSRQPLPTLDRKRYAPASGVARGAYVLADAEGGVARGDADRERERGRASRCKRTRSSRRRGSARASCRCPRGSCSIARAASTARACCRRRCARAIAIEQASTFGWERYVGQGGRIIGMETFGKSAPLKELQKRFGFEPERVVAVAHELL